MERAARTIFISLVLIMPSVLRAQDRLLGVKELVAFIENQSEYKVSFPSNLKQISLDLESDQRLLDPKELKRQLEPFGVETIVKGQVLILRQAGMLNITGYVREQGSGESLIGAHVIDLASGNGVTTNSFGFFSLRTTGDSISVSYIGYSPRILTGEDLQGDLIVELSATNQLLDEIIVSDYVEIQNQSQMSAMKLEAEDLKAIPVFMGETDVLKSLQLLPGVQSGTEGTSGFYVRGGGPDQNLILLDGVPVYNANHLFGFFSVFNADAINSVNLIKGGFPARYGGRLSSVVDIQMKEGNMQEIEGDGSIGLVATKLSVGGPLKKGKTSFMLSGRRTYLDLFTIPIARWSDSRRVVGYNFWDFNAKVNHIFNAKNRIYFSIYSGQDKFIDEYRFELPGNFDEREDATIRWGNVTSALRWNRKWTDQLFGNTTLTFSRYQFNLGTTIDYQYSEAVNTPNIFRENSYQSNIHDWGVKTDFDYFLNNQHLVRFGSNLVYHQLSPGVSAFKSQTETDTTFGSADLDMLEYYLYAEDQWSLSHGFILNAGVHFSGALTGKSYQSIQPRVSLVKTITPKLSVKGSFTKMTQYIHLLVNSGVGLPTDLWVPSTPKVRPQLSDQAALGIATTLGRFEFTLEGYYKWMDNLIEYKDGAGFLDVDDAWEDKVEFGSGKSYGVEFFIQKRRGRSTGWLGYTWSKTNRTFENLNFGNTFPYRYDRRHDLSLVYNLSINEKMDLGAVWVFGTGNSVTLPTSNYPKASWTSNGPQYDGFVKDYPGRNSSRMRDYHRLDVSISFRKLKQWGERKWVFGLYNAYNRLNPTFIEFNDEDILDKNFKQLSLFPLIPNATYQFKF